MSKELEIEAELRPDAMEPAASPPPTPEELANLLFELEQAHKDAEELEDKSPEDFGFNRNFFTPDSPGQLHGSIGRYINSFTGANKIAAIELVQTVINFYAMQLYRRHKESKHKQKTAEAESATQNATPIVAKPLARGMALRSRSYTVVNEEG